MADALRAASESASATQPAVRRRVRPDPFWGHFRDHGPDRWEAKVVSKLLAIGDLQPGWDGYAAPSISTDAFWFALVVLNNAMRPTTPCPQIVPTSSGAIQLEWHERGIDLEVKISAAYKCEVYYEDHANPAQAPLELALGENLAPLIRIMDDLASR